MYVVGPDGFNVASVDTTDNAHLIAAAPETYTTAHALYHLLLRTGATLDEESVQAAIIALGDALAAARGGRMTVREMLYHALQGYVRTDITPDFVEVNDALDTLTPPVESLVRELEAAERALKWWENRFPEAWSESDEEARKERDAALAPFREDR